MTFSIFPNLVGLTNTGFSQALSFSLCGIAHTIFAIIGQAIAKKISIENKEKFYLINLLRSIIITILVTVVLINRRNEYINSIPVSWLLLILLCATDGYCIVTSFNLSSNRVN